MDNSNQQPTNQTPKPPTPKPRVKKIIAITGAFFTLLLIISLIALQLTSRRPQISSLQILQVTPEQNTPLTLGDSTTSIAIIFDQPIDPASVTVTSSPNLNLQPTTLSHNPSQLILKVNTPWRFGASYTITLAPGIKSLDQQYSFDQPTTLNFTTDSQPPPLILPPGPDT